MILLCYIIFLFGTIADFICTALLINMVPESFFLPMVAISLTFVTGLFSVGIGSALSAMLDVDFEDEFSAVPIIRWLASYGVAFGALYFGIQEGKLFGMDYIRENVTEFAIFAVIAFLLCTAVFALHFFIVKKLSRAIIRCKEIKHNKLLNNFINRPPVIRSYSEPSRFDPSEPTELEKQRDKELEKFNEIVENQ